MRALEPTWVDLTPSRISRGRQQHRPRVKCDRMRGCSSLQWLVRKDKEIPVRAELAELSKQIGAWPAARTVERTIPQIHFASGIEPVKLSVGLRCIVTIEATNLKAKVDAVATTYAYWYQTRFATRTLAEVARELNCPLEGFCTSLGLGWNLEVITSEISLTPTQQTSY